MPAVILVTHPSKPGEHEPTRARWALHYIPDGTAVDPTDLSTCRNAGYSDDLQAAELEGQQHQQTAARVLVAAGVEDVSLGNVTYSADPLPPSAYLPPTP